MYLQDGGEVTTPTGEGPHQDGWNNGVAEGFDPKPGRRQAQGPRESNNVENEVDDNDHEIQ